MANRIYADWLSLFDGLSPGGMVSRPRTTRGIEGHWARGASEAISILKTFFWSPVSSVATCYNYKLFCPIRGKETGNEFEGL